MTLVFISLNIILKLSLINLIQKKSFTCSEILLPKENLNE